MPSGITLGQPLHGPHHVGSLSAPTEYRSGEQRHGVVGGPPSATKSDLYVIGGHDAQGMLYASAAASTGKYQSITTTSRRGRPDAPGASTAFVQAMSLVSDVCPHYMAKLDPDDPVSVDCIMEWQPPLMTEGMPDGQGGASEQAAGGVSSQDQAGAGTSSGAA
mmetsp:Transcript_59782/g.142290  ORF Transcript_59782/g.142290 Transcript_59782/m.142290 type:complete len:163 (-) Transcript_59782:169-657(-)